MKKILILGSAGMAGHTISRYLRSTNNYRIVDIARDNKLYPVQYQIDIEKGLEDLRMIYNFQNPDIIINCIGILVKQSEKNPTKAIYINSFFPHWLEKITKNTDIKIIHLSTDCVFSGKKGNYSETDIKDGEGWYAQSKAFGEIINNKDLTLRLSIVGDELKEDGMGLFNWFMKQKGTIKGFANHYWSGITTLELAKQINKIIDTNLTGLYQLAPDFKITKFNLLTLIKEVWNRQDISIIPDYYLAQDKSLVNNRKIEYNPEIPDYKIQLTEMKNWIENEN